MPLDAFLRAADIQQHKFIDHIAAGRPEQSGPWTAGDGIPAAGERLVDFFDRQSVILPQVIVLDDAHWADSASLRVWWRLAQLSAQAPILVIGASRPLAQDGDADRLRHYVTRRGGLRSLAPLSVPDMRRFASNLIGAAPGPGLARLIERAGGNPFYARELVDALVRDGAIVIRDDRAEVATGVGVEVPPTLADAIKDRLAVLSDSSRQVLRRAALLGVEFSMIDLATALHRPVITLAAEITQLAAAGLLNAEDDRLRFRHPLIRQVLLLGISPRERTAECRQVCHELASVGNPVERIGSILLETFGESDADLTSWASDWLSDNVVALCRRAPDLAIELVPKIADQMVGDHRREGLECSLASLLFRLGRNNEVISRGRPALEFVRDLEHRAELGWLLCAALLRVGRIDDKVEILEPLVRQTPPTSVWHGRLVALQGIGFSSLSLESAQAVEERALDIGEREGDRFTTGMALHALSLLAAYRNDHAEVIELTTRALDVFGEDPNFVSLYLTILTNRALAWINLDDIEQAAADLARAQVIAERVDVSKQLVVHTNAAEFLFRLGRWDDALVEVDALSLDDSATPVEARLVGSGLIALISCHRGDWAAASRLLKRFEGRDFSSAGARNNNGYLIMARAIYAEHTVGTAQAAELLASTLNLDISSGMHIRYLWLPTLTRLAMQSGNMDLAQAAAQASVLEAQTKPSSGRAAAAQRCAAMLAGDPGPLLEAAEVYRRTRRPLQLAQTLEEAAVVLASVGEASARDVYRQAVEAYLAVGALGDANRVDVRLQAFGLRRAPRRSRIRPLTGWGALSPTELRVADLAATGMSNPDIAAELFISRRTVESHVHSIMAKLEVHSRAEIASHAQRLVSTPR